MGVAAKKRLIAMNMIERMIEYEKENTLNIVGIMYYNNVISRIRNKCRSKTRIRNHYDG